MRYMSSMYHEQPDDLGDGPGEEEEGEAQGGLGGRAEGQDGPGDVHPAEHLLHRHHHGRPHLTQRETSCLITASQLWRITDQAGGGMDDLQHGAGLEHLREGGSPPALLLAHGGWPGHLEGEAGGGVEAGGAGGHQVHHGLVQQEAPPRRLVDGA